MRKCKVCKGPVEKPGAIQSPIVALCSWDCFQKFLTTKSAQARIKKAERDKVRTKKDRLETRSQKIKKAQIAFNRYINIRDSKKPCISCGCPPVGNKRGGLRDASHYRSRSSAPHLRFHPMNVWSSCKKCNRYMEGNLIPYRKALVEKLGLEKVETLENNNATRKFTFTELDKIRTLYTQKAKLYKKFRDD